MADNFFSIEFGEKFIKIADIKQETDLIEINHVGKINLIENFYNSDLEDIIKKQSDLINNFISALGINKKRIIICISNNLAYHQITEMPFLKEKELISAIKYQADQFIPMPIDDVNIDLEVIKNDEKNKKLLILIVAASKKIIEKVQLTSEMAGLKPEVVETKLSSLSRFIEWSSHKINPEKKDQNDLLIVDFDYFSSTFAYFNENPFIIKKTRNISLGFNLFLKEISVNLGLDEKRSVDLLKNYHLSEPSSYQLKSVINPLLNEFITEINRFTISKKPEKIFFIGEIINFPEFTNLIKEKFNDFDIEIFNPVSFFKKNSLIETILSEIPLYISVIGANLR